MSSFGDRVRVRESPETLAAGIALLEGEVYGFTTPSTTGVQAIGGAPDDYALSISLASSDATVWLRPDLVEFLDHNPGAEVVVGTKRLIRQADGSWLDEPVVMPKQGDVAELESGSFSRLVRAFKRGRKRDA
jgi:hypothetical protein